MTAKRKLILLFASILWVGGWIPLGHPNFDNLSKRTTFAKTQDLAVPAIATDHAAVERAFTRSFLLPQKLKNAGYSYREKAGQLPKWLIIVRDRVEQGKRMILLKEEISDAFSGALSPQRYSEVATAISTHVRATEKRLNLKIVTLLIPPKVFANKAILNPADIPPFHQRYFDQSSVPAFVGAEVNQRYLEVQLRDRGVTGVSLLQLYEKLRDDFYPLYPNGDSHWARILIEFSGAEVVRQLSAAGLLNPKCVDLGRTALKPNTTREVYFGDLANATLISMQSSLGESFTTSITSDRLSSIPAKIVVGCPELYISGTSYTEQFSGRGDLIQAMQLVYLGRVRDFSAVGRKPFHEFEELPSNLTRDSLVIWEFPFRYAKYFSLVEGKVQYQGF